MRSRTEPATDPETRAWHEQILRDAGLWDRPQQTDERADALLTEYENDEREQP